VYSVDARCCGSCIGYDDAVDVKAVRSSAGEGKPYPNRASVASSSKDEVLFLNDGVGECALPQLLCVGMLLWDFALMWTGRWGGVCFCFCFCLGADEGKAAAGVDSGDVEREGEKALRSRSSMRRFSFWPGD